MKEFLDMIQAEQVPITNALERVIFTLPKSVQELASYALLSGGKRLRPMLSILSARLFSYSHSDIYDVSIVLEMFHVASLLHDDILDAADTRRGKESTHIKYGIKPCILAGDALLAAGNKHMSTYHDSRLMETISNALLHTSVGEIEEIVMTGKIAPNQDAYLRVIEGKTAWILRSACEVGAIKAGASQEDIAKMGEYGLNLGMAFQIVDDALDFAPESITGKPCGGDLRERKCTPPILMYVESLTPHARKDFEEKFAGNSHLSFSEEELEYIIQQIVERKYPEKTRDLADVYLEKAGKALDSWSGIYKDMLMQTLLYVQIRSK